MIDPCSADAFEAKYAADDDPWQFRSSPYEIGRYEAIEALLVQDRYPRAYEPACSIGELTLRLAPRCDQLLAVDVSPTAVATTRRRCAQLPNVRTEVASVADLEESDLDLIVFSEVGYYFGVDDLDDVIARLVEALAPDAELVACHWTGRSPDHVLTGETVHRRIGRHRSLVQHRSQLHEGFLLEGWRRR